MTEKCIAFLAMFPRVHVSKRYMCILECDALPFIIYSHYKRMHHCFVDILQKKYHFLLDFWFDRDAI